MGQAQWEPGKALQGIRERQSRDWRWRFRTLNSSCRVAWGTCPSRGRGLKAAGSGLNDWGSHTLKAWKSRTACKPHGYSGQLTTSLMWKALSFICLRNWHLMGSFDSHQALWQTMVDVIYLALKQCQYSPDVWSPSFPISEGSILLATGTSRRSYRDEQKIPCSRSCPQTPSVPFVSPPAPSEHRQCSCFWGLVLMMGWASVGGGGSSLPFLPHGSFSCPKMIMSDHAGRGRFYL